MRAHHKILPNLNKACIYVKFLLTFFFSYAKTTFKPFFSFSFLKFIQESVFIHSNLIAIIMVQLNFIDFSVINLNYPINYQIHMMMNLSFDRIKFTVWSFFVFISIVFIFFYYVILVYVFILDSIIFLNILHLDLIDF